MLLILFQSQCGSEWGKNKKKKGFCDISMKANVAQFIFGHSGVP